MRLTFVNHMAAPNEHQREIAALRDRTSRLSAAALRVTASLDEATVLQEIVERGKRAYGRDETVARALEAGAEDYIVKPFSPTEFTARVGVAFRKRLEPGPFVLGNLSIDHARRRVTVGGVPVRLTATEYELLRVLSVNAGHVTTYEALLRRVWGGRGYARPQLVRAFVKKPRTKLGDDSTDPTYIFNERGVGYRMPKPGKV